MTRFSMLHQLEKVGRVNLVGQVDETKHVAIWPNCADCVKDEVAPQKTLRTLELRTLGQREWLDPWMQHLTNTGPVNQAMT